MVRPVALVTGGRRGIGRGIALALAKRGFDLVINDRVEDDAVAETLRLLGEAGAQARFVAHDVADVDSHEAFVARAWEALGAIHCLVNNAGVQVARRGDLLEDTPAEYDRLMSVNLRAPYFLSIAVARRMRGLTDGLHRAIVNVASVNAFMASPNRGPYCLSKTGVSMMTQLFAVRLAQEGIMVNEVRPGIIQTDMTAGVYDQYTAQIESGISPVRRWGQPADIGAAVALLASGDLPFVTGESIHVDGGLHIPRL